MKKLTFKIPLYEVEVTLAQVEGKEDEKGVEVLCKSIKMKQEHIDEVLSYVRNGSFNGGDTFRNFRLCKMLVIFYPMKGDYARENVYNHEKRHVEDRVLEFASVNDVESAGLLAGYLGERFYEFRKLQK